MIQYTDFLYIFHILRMCLCIQKIRAGLRPALTDFRDKSKYNGDSTQQEGTWILHSRSMSIRYKNLGEKTNILLKQETMLKSREDKPGDNHLDVYR